MAVAYAPGGLIKVGPFPLSGSGAPASTLIGQLGQDYFDTTTSPPTLYVFNGSTWTQPGSGSSTGANIVGTVTINTTGPATTTIGTGGTGAVAIGNATGNTAVTGDLVVSGAITSTLGNITATNGNIVKGTAGNKDVYTSVASTIVAGANSAGTVTLVSGAAIVATTAVTASSIIRLYRQGVGSTGAAALGMLTISAISAGVSFTITSAVTATATSTATTDVSVVAWEIVN